MTRPILTLRWVLTTFLVLVGVGVLVRLGIWQLDRLAQRRAFNARVTAQLNQPELDLNLDMPVSQLYNMEYRNVVVKGTYDFSQQVLLRNQAWDNRIGFHLLTPLEIDGSPYAILVDRGWIPIENAGNLDPFNEPGKVVLRGQLRRPQTKPDFGGVPDPTLAPGENRLSTWNIINLSRIQQQTNLKLLPVYLQEAPAPSHTQLPYRSLTNLELTEGPHFGYALQWFTFAAILGLGYPFYARKQLSKQVREYHPNPSPGENQESP